MCGPKFDQWFADMCLSLMVSSTGWAVAVGRNFHKLSASLRAPNRKARETGETDVSR